MMGRITLISRDHVSGRKEGRKDGGNEWIKEWMNNQVTKNGARKLYNNYNSLHAGAVL